MAPRKMKMRKKQITNDIHTYTYVGGSGCVKTFDAFNTNNKADMTLH